MLLREASDRELIQRRDELLRQVEAINTEISRRFRERCDAQQQELDGWLRFDRQLRPWVGTP